MTPVAEQQEITSRAPRISVVIVSLNRAANLRESLATLGDGRQVVVVDNGSSDGSAQLDADFPHARFSKLPKNFGLTKALNIGIRAAEGEYILLLHDDVRIRGADVTQLADYLETHADAAAVCPMLNGPQMGSLPSPSAAKVEWREAEGGEEIIAECVNGAAILFRTSFLRALRHIDERYGTFGSAIELSQQVKRSGKKLVILREVTAHHEGGESPVSASVLDGDRVAGMAAFLGKHHGLAPSFFYRLKTALVCLFTFRFKALAGALTGAKVDGTG